MDPDAVLSDWRELVRQNPHIHGPEAAARAGVTEAALLAARIGHGATGLLTDLAQLLAPLPSWGKVLIAARTDLGVMLDILHVQQVSPAGTALAVRGVEHSIVIGCDGVDRCYLLEDHDTHGHTYSINWFDAQGQVLGRVFLFSKTERREALEHIGRCASADAVRTWVPGGGARPEHRRIHGRAGEEIVVAFGERAATLALRAVLSCSRWPAMQLEM